jgi:predicted acylesterase/phospholipase RssA
MGKKALVISGGGSRGAFAVGAIDYMVNQLGLTFDIVAGTSTGALIAPLVVVNDIPKLKHLYSSVTQPDILGKIEIGWRDIQQGKIPKALNDTSPLRNLLEEQITTAVADQIISPTSNNHKYMFLATSNLQSGDIVYFHNVGPQVLSIEPDTKVQKIESRQALINAMLASASIPVFMPPVEMRHASQRMQQYVDGGVRELTPLKIAIDNGATEAYVILLSPEQQTVQNGECENVFSILKQTIELLCRDVMIHDIYVAELHSEMVAYLIELKSVIQQKFSLSDQDAYNILSTLHSPNRFLGKAIVIIKLIQPRTAEDLTTDALVFDPDEMKRVMQNGYNRAQEVLGRRVVPPLNV